MMMMMTWQKWLRKYDFYFVRNTTQRFGFATYQQLIWLKFEQNTRIGDIINPFAKELQNFSSKASLTLKNPTFTCVLVSLLLSSTNKIIGFWVKLTIPSYIDKCTKIVFVFTHLTLVQKVLFAIVRRRWKYRYFCFSESNRHTAML